MLPILVIIFGISNVGCLQNYSLNSTHPLEYSIFAYFSNFIAGVITAPSHKHSNLKQATNNHPIKKNVKLSIFEGRGAVRNLAIFHILVAAGPLSIGDIQRRLNKIRGLEVTYYASLNKRIHALARGGYIGEVKPTADQAARYKVCLYEVHTKFYLAYYLKGKSLDEILSRLDEPNAMAILSELINAYSTDANYFLSGL
jgi:hypothetical protein